MLDHGTVSSMAAMILITVCGSWIASRAPFFKKSRILQGIFLGVLTFSVVFFLQKGSYLQSCIGFMDFPVLIGGLFFGPVVGLVSAAVMLLVKIVLEFCNAEHSVGCLTGCIGSLLVCGYTICVSKLSFNAQRPTVFSGFVAAAFGECIHLAFVFVMGMDKPAFTYRIVSDLFLSMAAGAGIAAALFALICPRDDGSRRFFAQNNLSFSVFGIAYILVLVGGIEAAKGKVSETLKNGARDFQQTIDEHIAFAMHRCSSSICRKIADYTTVSREELEKLAKDHSLNEVNIIGADGKLLASSSREVQKYVGTYQSYREDMRFRQMVREGNPKAVVKKTIRPSLQAPHDITCFIEIPFPDLNAFLKPGYWDSSFQSEFRQLFMPHVSAKPIGTNGFYLIADQTGRIVGPVHNHPDAIARKAYSIGLQPDYALKPEGEVFKAYLFNEKTACIRMKKIGDLDVYACLPIHEFFNPILINIAIAGIALLGLSFILHWMMRRINRMSREREEHINSDLLFARQIQADELQEEAPDTVHYKISATMLPAKIVGGDFYDFYTLGNNRIFLSVADVSGKGMAAAIFMMKVKTTLKLYSYRCDNIKDIMEVSNNEICRKNRSMMFVTAFSCIFDPQTGDLEFVCAGHNPPLVIRADGTVEWVKCEKNLPLGIRFNGEYRPQKIRLNHKDRLFLYTDGVTEAKNDRNELYGSLRLRAIIEQMHDREDLTGTVIQDVKGFSGATEQADDITILTMLYR